MLIRLSEIDSEIEKLEETQREVPLTIQSLQQQIASLQLEVNRLDRQKMEAENQKNKFSETIQNKSEWLKNREEQIKDLKTNKEFHAAQKEISLAKKEMMDAQTAINQINEQITKLQLEEASAKSSHQPKIDELIKLITVEKEKAVGIQPQTEGKLKLRRGLIVEIDSNALQIYERVRVKVSPALAKAEDCVCLECGSRMQPQLYNQLHTLETLHFCKNCKRILYIEEVLQQPSI